MADTVGNFGFLGAGLETGFALFEEALRADGVEDDDLLSALELHNSQQVDLRETIEALLRDPKRRALLARIQFQLGRFHLGRFKLFAPKAPLVPRQMSSRSFATLSLALSPPKAEEGRGEGAQGSNVVRLSSADKPAGAGNGGEEVPPLEEPSGLEKTGATPESFLNVLESEFKRIQTRYLSLQTSLPPEISQKYSEELSKIEQRITYWMEAILALEELEKKERKRFEEDILIGERILLNRLLQLGANIFSEPVDEERFSSVGLRSDLGIVPKRRPKELEIDITKPAKGKIVPALVNHDIGFGRNLALRPAQIIAINRLRGLFRLRKERPVLNGATEELLRGTVVMPVGGGKTRVMVASFALAIEEGLFSSERGDKFIILNHTEQIHEQNKEVVELLGAYFERKFGRKLKVTEYKAETKDASGDVVVVSIPTINTEGRRGEFEAALQDKLGSEGRIVMTAIDEIHHLELGKGRSKESWQEAVKMLRKVSPDFYRIGFTATPTGKEGPYIARIRELDLMRAGVTPRTYLVRVEGEDLSQLKVSEGARDFQTHALVSTLLKYPDRNKKLYEALERHGIRREDRSPSGQERFEGVLGFAADGRHAQRMARDYQTYSPSPLVGEGRGEGFKRRKIEIVGDEKGRVSAKNLAQALAKYEKGEVDALAVVISDSTAPTMRQTILQLVVEGKIEAAFNVGIWTEGADLWMFTHLLGAKPTFSRYQKGQERGRLNRRGPDDVGAKGELLSDKPKILFDVIDQYRGDRALVRYGDLMGVRGHTAAAYGELFDAMVEEVTTAIDSEGRAIAHKDLEAMVQKKREIAKPDPQALQAPLTAKLWEIFENQYGKDIEAMAQDLGIPVEEMEQILQGQGWINARWFLRRLATLLYQDRETFVGIYNAERGLKDERVTDADIQILKSALAVYYSWENFQGGEIKIEGEVVIAPNAFNELARGSISDIQWRNIWRGMAIYFGEKAKETGPKQEEGQKWFNDLNRYLFQREKWPGEAGNAKEKLLLETRKDVALKFGGRLPGYSSIEGIPRQGTAKSTLTRWLEGKIIKFGKGASSENLFYAQVRSLLIGLGLTEAKAGELIIDAVFESEKWDRDESTAAKRLLYQARRLVARKFSGRLLNQPNIEGVPWQSSNTPLTRWLQGKTMKFGRGSSAGNFYARVRNLLIGLGLTETKAGELIIDAVFESEKWDRDESTAAKRLLYQARRLVARKFGGRLLKQSNIEGVPGQFSNTPLTRWLQGEEIKFGQSMGTTRFYAQVRSLLVELGLAEAKVEELMVEAAFGHEGWNRDKSTATKRLLYQIRRLVALKFGGRLPNKPGVEGVSRQNQPRALLTRFLSGESVPFTPSLLSQIRALLLHKGANSPEEVEWWISALEESR